MVSKKSLKQPIVDRLLNEGLCASRDIAEKQILAGLVRVEGQIIDKVGARVSDQATVTVTARKDFVSRGAYKLEAALKAFPIAVAGAVCADVGVCTGGFTEVLLLNGAAKVYAIDVGYGDLDWKIRSDSRVVVMERTNARHLETLGEPISLVVIDVSFISLSKILPAVSKWLAEKATIVALIKPQFEARREEIGEGGIITDPLVHDRVIQEVVSMLPTVGLTLRGVLPSPILGTEGNKEFLLWAERVPVGA